MRNREGFTLVELMLVTLIIGVLATVAVAGYSGLRERSMIAVTRTEVRNVLTAAEAHRAITGFLPATLEELVDAGLHRQSVNVNYCAFQREDGPPADIYVEAAHQGSNVHLIARYPSQGVAITETVGATDCS